MRDLDEEDPADREAREQEINFIHLDGTIGCMVNGAGLAMTTMDLVKRAGGEPANFLDIGGGAKAETVAAAMRLILADPSVEAILVNIFGGITRGDEVARGLVEARARQSRAVPMVVRIVGTNAEAAGDPPRGGIPDGRQPRSRRGTGRRGRAPGGPGSRRSRAMSILVGRDTRLVVQGITGREGEFHSRQMQAYGTTGRRRNALRQGRPACPRRHGPRVRHRPGGGPRRRGRTPASSTCRPRPLPMRSSRPSTPGIGLVVCITERIPALDMLRVMPVVREPPAYA